MRQGHMIVTIESFHLKRTESLFTIHAILLQGAGEASCDQSKLKKKVT